MFRPSTRILIVDDLESLRNLLKTDLVRIGFRQISEAEDGREAFQAMIAAKAAGAPFELVISDWNMPNVSGLELLKIVRSITEWKLLPFIILTTENEKEKIVAALSAGVTNYMMKPIEPKMLEEKLRRAWQKINDQSPK